MIEYEHQNLTHNWKLRKVRKGHRRGKDGKYKYIIYNDSIITFDIEVTSAWQTPEGKIIGYTPGKSAEYWNNLTPLSLCYIWQASVDGIVYYSRYLQSFVRFIEELPDAQNIIWVHNLAYEFHTLLNIFEFEKVFARAPHKPIYAIPKDYENVQFRCTYMLTRLSLDSWGKELGVKKLTGDLNYEKIRTPLTKLTKKELKYCEQDCIVVDAGVRSYVERYGDQWKIPLTQTGTIRRVVKEMLTEDKEYMRAITRLVPRNALEYKRLQKIFAGGYTHANRRWSGQVIRGIIEHYDFNSAYPYAMVAYRYPCQPWIYTGLKHIPDINTFEDTAYIFDLHFKNIRSISYNTYIQASKCAFDNFDDVLLDNGRVMAGSFSITVTEQDYLTIIENYQWDELEVVHVWKSHKAYLPRDLILYILDLFKNKTSLKNVPGKEDIYAQSKQYINSLFGMTVTAIIQTEIEFDGSFWHCKPLTQSYVDEALKDIKTKNWMMHKYFLNYAWGCYVCAYVRRSLWRCIHKYDREVLYADTDSIFLKGKGSFEWYNEEVNERLKVSAAANYFNLSSAMPKTQDGKTVVLGHFAKEPDVSEFVTLGAKRYCERRINDGQLHLTISGINKGAVSMLNDDIENFKDGFDFDKDDPSVHKSLSTYISEQGRIEWPDGYISTQKHGINMRRTGYKLEITDEYKDLIKYGEMTVDDLPDNFFVTTRGRFTIG